MSYLETFKDVLTQEAHAIERVKGLVSEELIQKLISLFDYLSATQHELVICGVGKSGDIGNKIVSTLNSIGLRSSFLHPIEALHGDLGRLRSGDAVMFISKSGTTEEITKLIPYLPVAKERRIALVGNTSSPIAQECHLVFDCSVEKEACINNQAPTTSSTVTLAMGDAIAVCFEHYAGLSKESFATNHPGGLLGKSLRLKVEHLMVDKKECATLEPGATLQDAIMKMTEFPTGLCAIEEKGKFVGLIVEGDIRRSLADSSNLKVTAKEMMNENPLTISPNDLALDALRLMENRERPISVLPVINDGVFLGVIRLHDLLREGLSS